MFLYLLYAKCQANIKEYQKTHPIKTDVTFELKWCTSAQQSSERCIQLPNDSTIEYDLDNEDKPYKFTEKRNAKDAVSENYNEEDITQKIEKYFIPH